MSDWTERTGPGIYPKTSRTMPKEGYRSPLPHPGPYVVQGGAFGDSPNRGHLDPRQGQSPQQRISVPSYGNSNSKEQAYRYAGLGVGLVSLATEHVLSHPCIVLRRQCQVNHDSSWYHLTPFTLFQTIFNIQRHQSATTLWKGIGSALMVKGVAVATETAISEVTPLPKEVTRHTSIKKLLGHLVLKGLSYIVITPFYASSLVETVQSEIASERPGVFDCFREGAGRLISLTTAQTTRLLPVWKLILPTMTYGVVHYVVASIAQYTVLVSVRADIHESKASNDGTLETSLYQTYYPELIASFTGSVVADIVLYPLETVLHRLCMQGTRTIIDNTDNGLGVIPIITRYEGVIDCFRGIITEEGFGGLYKGFGALILQYGMHMAFLKLVRLIFRFMSNEGSTTPNRMPVSIEEWSRLTNQSQQTPPRGHMGASTSQMGAASPQMHMGTRPGSSGYSYPL